MKPPAGDRCVLLTLVDFTANKIWGFDMNEDEQIIGDVQERLVRWYHEVETPAVVWSDNGSQFASVVVITTISPVAQGLNTFSGSLLNYSVLTNPNAN